MAVTALDQLVKYAVFFNMDRGQSIPVIADILHITYVQNRGAAFSLWEHQWIILVALPAVLIAAGLILLYRNREKWDRMMLLSVSFICGGGIGNLIDRIANGFVVDMFDCRFIPFVDFPVFNVADIFICTGCALMLIDVLFADKNRDGEKVPDGEE